MYALLPTMHRFLCFTKTRATINKTKTNKINNLTKILNYHLLGIFIPRTNNINLNLSKNGYFNIEQWAAFLALFT